MDVLATATRQRGRPRGFDIDVALDRAIEVFRASGYEASSMADLERATGLNKSSIYNTFGSKEGLFAAALNRYVRARFDAASAMLAASNGGLDDLHRLLEMQQAESTSDWGTQGCLAINAMTELGPREAAMPGVTTDYRAELTRTIRLPLERAVALGEIDAEQLPHAVALLTSLTLGLGVLMRSCASPETIEAHFQAMHAMIESWRKRLADDAPG